MHIPSYIFVEQTGDGYVLANPLNRAVVQLTPEFYNNLKDPAKQINLSEDERNACTDMGFLLDDAINDNEYVKYQLEKTRLENKDLTLYIMLSTLCNFRCIYCYECGQVKSITMPETIQEKMLKWIEQTIISEHLRSLKIYLYGGEPTLYWDRFIKVLTHLKKVCIKNHVKLEVNMISNAYLLTYEKLKQLSKFNLNEVHISVDGPKDIHNQRRPLKNGGETFDKIFALLTEIGKHKTTYKIIVRIGVDQSNINKIEPLLKDLEVINKKHNLFPYVSPITETTSGNSCNNCGKNNLLTTKTIIAAFKKAYDLLWKYHFDIPDFHTYGPCMVLSNSSLVIYPNGDLYKCLDMVGIPKYILGNIQDTHFKAPYYQFLSAPHLQYCYQKKCPFISICGGGCLIKAIVHDSMFNKPECPKQVIDGLTHYLLRKKYGNQ